MNIITEIYQFLFISSNIFMIYFFSELFIKMYGRFVRKNMQIKYNPNNGKKVLFWISLTTFLTYLI